MPDLIAYPRACVRMTRKRYTVVFACVDPPMPVETPNTNSLDQARRAFAVVRQAEIDATRETGSTGGEWTLRLVEHTPASSIHTRSTDHGLGFVYDVDYHGSRVVEQFDYMDALKEVT